MHSVYNVLDHQLLYEALLGIEFSCGYILSFLVNLGALLADYPTKDD